MNKNNHLEESERYIKRIKRGEDPLPLCEWFVLSICLLILVTHFISLVQSALLAAEIFGRLAF